VDQLIKQVRPFTKSSIERMGAMVAAARHVEDDKIAGDIVECGVWRGGNIIIARKIAPSKICWLYDTFEGMTEPTEVDRKASGASAIDIYRTKGKAWNAISVDEVQQCLESCDVYDLAKLKFIKGPVEKTLLEEENLPHHISLLRLDTDWYESTRLELEVLYPRLSPGGILIVDDYGHWMGAKMAVDRYFGKRMPPMTKIDYTAIAIVKG
jgi:O-methyltransferase